MKEQLVGNARNEPVIGESPAAAPCSKTAISANIICHAQALKSAEVARSRTTALWPHSVLNAKPSLRAGACKQFSLTPSHRGGSTIPNVLCRFLLLSDGRAIRSMPIRNGELFDRSQTLIYCVPSARVCDLAGTLALVFVANERSGTIDRSKREL